MLLLFYFSVAFLIAFFVLYVTVMITADGKSKRNPIPLMKDYHSNEEKKIGKVLKYANPISKPFEVKRSDYLYPNEAQDFFNWIREQ